MPDKDAEVVMEIKIAMPGERLPEFIAWLRSFEQTAPDKIHFACAVVAHGYTVAEMQKVLDDVSLTDQVSIQMLNRPLSGELMICVLCDRHARAKQGEECKWRCVEVDKERWYVCDTCMPPEGSSAAQYSEAYQKVMKKISERRNKP